MLVMRIGNRCVQVSGCYTLSRVGQQMQRAQVAGYDEVEHNEQRKNGDKGPYKFMRRDIDAKSSLTWYGWGPPVNPVGLIVSCFRPSDDATVLPFLVPSNFMAVISLRKSG